MGQIGRCLLEMKELLAAARGDRPADLVIRGAKVANVYTLEYESLDVAVFGDRIVGLGEGFEGREVVDAGGKTLIPGMIDGHVHIESTMLTPPVFADSVVTRGTTTVMADPHEIANALGLKGVEYMYLSSRGLNVDVFLGAPSCVPASPFETPFEELGSLSVSEMFRRGWCQHLAEVMNFPGVINGDTGVWGKIQAAGNVPLTGHAPQVTGRALNAYALAGISSDHECVGPEEALEKLRRGLWVMMREGASFPNLRTLLPIVKDNPTLAARCMAVTDDITARYLAEVGHMDVKVRIMIEEGLDPLTALRMVTLSPADYFGLRDRGAIAPGLRADLVLVDDLASCRVSHVWKNGRAVVEGGRLIAATARATPVPFPAPVPIVPPTPEQLAVPASGKELRVIGVAEGEVLTRTLTLPASVKDGQVVPDPDRDLAKIVVLERHRGTGRFAVGFVSGLGIKRGALASSVAHDAHNFVAAGMDDRSIVTALASLCASGGGLAVAEGESVKGVLKLPVGGLMTNLDAASAARELDELESKARTLGVTMAHPFMALSFLCLSVIPELRLTDQGYVDITRGGLQSLFADA